MKNSLFLLLFCLLGSLSSKAQLYGLDPSFATTGLYLGDTGACVKMAVQQDGKIIITDGERKADLQSKAMRFNTNGSIDSSFGINGRFYIPTSINFYYVGISSLCLQPDGKILLGGEVELINGASSDLLLIRLKANGKLDSSFGNNGVVVTNLIGKEFITSVALQADGKIVVCGEKYWDNQMLIVRYSDNGAIDSTFGTYGIVSSDVNTWGLDYPSVNNIAIMSDGRIVVGAYSKIISINPPFGDYAFTAIRLLTSGLLDTSFNHTGVAYTNDNLGGLLYCKAMCLQPDGSVLLGGYADSLAVARFGTSGTLDVSFGVNGLVKFDPAGKIVEILLQPDGKLLIATNPEGFPYPDTCYAIYRLLPNGQMDYSFGINGKVLTKTPNASNMIGCLALQSDGKILAGSGFMQNGFFPPKLMLVRYTPNATSTQTITLKEGFSIYPNPANKIVYIQNPTRHPISKLSLYSMEGTLLRTSRGTTDHLNTEGLPKGMYILQFQFADQPTLTRKLIIQHY